LPELFNAHNFVGNWQIINLSDPPLVCISDNPGGFKDLQNSKNGIYE
jgi:hypothetical protein